VPANTGQSLNAAKFCHAPTNSVRDIHFQIFYPPEGEKTYAKIHQIRGISYTLDFADIVPQQNSTNFASSCKNCSFAQNSAKHNLSKSRKTWLNHTTSLNFLQQN